MCASHSGEEEHVRVVESLFVALSLDETHLRCGAHPPLHEPSAEIFGSPVQRPGPFTITAPANTPACWSIPNWPALRWESYLDPATSGPAADP